MLLRFRLRGRGAPASRIPPAHLRAASCCCSDVDVFRQLYNPKLNPRYNGKQFSSGTLHRAAGGAALRTTGAGLAGTCTQDNLRGPFLRGCVA